VPLEGVTVNHGESLDVVKLSAPPPEFVTFTDEGAGSEPPKAALNAAINSEVVRIAGAPPPPPQLGSETDKIIAKTERKARGIRRIAARIRASAPVKEDDVWGNFAVSRARKMLCVKEEMFAGTQ
jgi:hypothetical protein